MVVPMGGKSASQQNQNTNSNTNSAFNQNGTTTTNAILSDYWKNAFGGAEGSLGANGLTSFQGSGLNFLSGQLNDNPNAAALGQSSRMIDAGQNNLGFLGGQIADLTRAAPRQLGAGATSAAPGSVIAPSGASEAGKYYDPFQRDVIDATAADYDADVAQQLNGMRAGRDAAGAFGDRSAGADAQFLSNAARGRASILSGIRSQGFDKAQTLGQADARALLSANTTNVGNAMANNQFNAGLLDSRDKFNVSSGYQGDQQRLQANNQAADYSNTAVGMEQQRLNNTTNNNATRAALAQMLTGLGGTGFENFMGLLGAAQGANGQQTDTTNTGTANSATAARSASKGKSASAGVAG